MKRILYTLIGLMWWVNFSSGQVPFVYPEYNPDCEMMSVNDSQVQNFREDIKRSVFRFEVPGFR